MSLLYDKNAVSARRKIFPSLGGIHKKIYPKTYFLETTLNYLTILLGRLKDKIKLEGEEKREFEEIQKDLRLLSKFKKMKRNHFEILCRDMLKKYKI